MAKEHAQKFIEHIQKDPVLRKKVNDATDHIIKVAGEHGHQVNRADLKAALKEHWAKAGDEDEAAVILSEAPGF
ncbi:MAG: Nif11-like leader peptide family natural product precursor [Candidatus Korobacteraceae bacterium]|jgi:predicted ribosomally synthesized peptide with nif11-like leader